MNDLKQFNIQYIGLKNESHTFKYHIDNTFFEAFSFDEFFNSNINVSLTLEKKSTLMNLFFTANGSINIACDLSGEPFDLEIHAELSLIVKFGEEFNDENDEILVLPYTEFQLNIAQYIYEMIVLAIPTKRVHPKVLDGTLESEALKKLEKLRVKETNTTENVDPRWDKLKDLIKEKKT